MATPTYYESFSQQPSANESANGAFDQILEATTSNGDAATAGSSPADADLSYRHNARGHSLNNPPPDGWAYPHKKGIGTGSNLDPFKDDILLRTERGENCKTIAHAMRMIGVQTSDRAVSRVRIKWGWRKRAERRPKTPPPGSDAARLSAKSKIQAMRKAELIRMTKEGLSAEDICTNLTNRGMELKKGVATVLRLQSAWGLAHDEKRWLGNFRHQCHKKAKAQQLEAFTEIAKEIGVQDLQTFLQEKMSEEPARRARHELALKLMGEHAPTNPERRKLQIPRRTDGPYDRPAPLAGDDELSHSDTSESDVESHADSPLPAKRLRSEVGGQSTRTAEGNYRSDGRPAEIDGCDGVSLDHASYLGGIALDMDDGYTPMNDQEDDDMFVAQDDDDGSDRTTLVETGSHEHAHETMPQPTIAPRPLKMWDPHRHHAMDSRRSPPVTTVTPAKRGKARPPKQSTAKPSPIPATAVPTPPMQTNLSHDHQAQTRSHVYLVPGAAPPTTLTTFALESSTASATAIASPMPELVLRTEEAEANKTTLSTLDQYNVAAKIYKELLEARNEKKPLPGSLTGLPPSAKEVDTAKRKLKEATQAMMLALD